MASVLYYTGGGIHYYKLIKTSISLYSYTW